MQKTDRQRGCHRVSPTCKEINASGLFSIKEHETMQDERRELRPGAGHGGALMGTGKSLSHIGLAQ